MNGIGLDACRGFPNWTGGGFPPPDGKSVQLVPDGPCRQFAKSGVVDAADTVVAARGEEESSGVPLSERKISDASRPLRNTRIVESWLEQSVLQSGVELSADVLKAAAAGGETSLSKKELKLLEAARSAAAVTLRALDAFTGRELADFNARPAVLEALQAAIEGQMQLADALMQAANRTGSAKLMTLSTSANLRACEISRLACEMKMCADGDRGAPGWNLDEKGHVDRIAEVSARSHGTMAALERDERFDRLFTALGELEDPSSTDKAPVQVKKVADLLAECADRLAALKRTVTNVAALEALEKRLAEAHERFADARHSAVRKIAVDFVGGWKLPEVYDRDALRKLLDEARPGFPPAKAAKNILAAAERLSRAFREYKDAWLDRFDPKRHDRGDDCRKDAFVAMWDAIEEFHEKCRAWPDFLKEVRFNAVVDAFSHSNQAAKRLERICEVGSEFSRQDAIALLDGRLEFGSVAAAAGWGYGPDRVDSELAGAKLVGEEVKGKGSFNTVKLCTFRRPDGKECQRVFKAENGAWSSLSHGVVRIIGDYNENQLGIDVNFASHDIAEMVGCGGRIVKSSFGILDGVPGIFQEVAPGLSAAHKMKAPDDDAFSFADFYAMKNDPDEAKRALYRKMAGEFCRQLNQLQWLDLLAGQVDRSESNYMVRLGKDGSVSVKGIDNDESFPSSMTGLWIFKFGQNQAEKLKKLLGNEGWEKCVKRDAIVPDAESGKLTVDVNGFAADESIALLKAGFRSLFVPNHMDKDMLDGIRSIVDDPKRLEEYRQKLRNDHLTEDQINAAVSRLLAVKALGEHLEKIGRVFDAHGEPNGWEPSDKDIFDKLAENVSLEDERGSLFMVKNLARTFVPPKV